MQTMLVRVTLGAVGMIQDTHPCLSSPQQPQSELLHSNYISMSDMCKMSSFQTGLNSPSVGHLGPLKHKGCSQYAVMHSATRCRVQYSMHLFLHHAEQPVHNVDGQSRKGFKMGSTVNVNRTHGVSLQIVCCWCISPLCVDILDSSAVRHNQ